MATVYHAVQEGPHGFENEVAVKLVHAELLAAYPHVLEMLVDEARVAARIRHPNVVRILDLVEEAERFYMVMDFVDGLSMRQVLDTARELKQRPPMSPVIEVLAAACRGLQAAHELTLQDGTSLGLVHRDVKPGNILVSIGGEVKVGDFGIALFGDRMTESTAHGQLKGTPAYMSPEQVMGETLDGRSDIFSMGLTLYTLLTTKLAFTGENPMKIAVKIASESLDPHIEELEALLPGLGEVFGRACEKDPELRYQTASDLGLALKRLHDGFETTTPIGEMLAAAGWRPIGERGDPVVPHWPEPDPDEEEDTDAGARRPRQIAGLAADAPTVAPDQSDPAVVHEPAPAAPPPPAPEAPAEVAPAPEPSAAPPPPPPPRREPPPMVGSDAEVTPPLAQSAPPMDFDDPTVVEAAPAGAAPVEVILPGEGGGFAPRPAPGAPPPGRRAPPGAGPPPGMRPPPGPRPPGAPPYPPGAQPAPGAYPPPGRPPGAGAPPPPGAWAPPGAGPQGPGRGPAEQTMHPPGGAPRPRVQPIRDYRGRVVRKKASSPESTRVGRLEIIGVGVAFLLLLATVVVIVAVQFRGGPPDDPRFVDGEPTLATGAASAGKAPVATPAPRPAATPLVVVREEVSPTPTSAPVATPTPAPRPTERTSRAKATPARPPTPAAAEEVDEVTPRPVGTGLVTVNTYPYSQVFIDGKSLGRTPLVGKEIRVGKHEVKLVFPTLGNEEVVETIFVEAGKEAKVVRRLTEGQ
jgi:eukaryotic-like serine/threonine-protein kinase